MAKFFELFFKLFLIKKYLLEKTNTFMGCACKSNTGAKKQVTQVVKRTTAPVTHSVNKSSGKGRKQIIIKRPSRS